MAKLLGRLIRGLGWALLVMVTGFLLAKGITRRPFLDIGDVVPGVVFDFPVHLVFHAEAGGHRLVVAEKAGRVVWVRRDSTRIEGQVLDIRSKVYSAGDEEGLLSVAIDPRFPASPYLYVFYSAEHPKRSVVSRFRLGSDFVANPSSELKILEIPKKRNSHNGGLLAFDESGYLFVSVGDGESHELRDQMPLRRTWFSSILRLDVSHGSESAPYRVPSDNPFVGARDGSRPEIWAHGFRNPWRFSQDRATGSLIVADVGAGKRESIAQVKKGENHGWPIKEGDLCHSEKYGSCSSKELVPPLASVDHALSVSVTGAAIYRGKEVPSLAGRIIFADYIRGVFSFPYRPGTTTTRVRKDIFKWPTPRGPHAGKLYGVSSLIVGPDDEIYLVNARGTLGKIKELGWWKWLRGFLYEMVSFS